MAPHDLDSNGADLLWQEFEEAKRRTTAKPDLIQELLGDLEVGSGESRPLSIDSYFLDRMSGAEQRLGEIRQELTNRLSLHADFIAEIETQLHYVQRSLEKFAGWGVGYNTGVDVKRNFLERQLQQLRTERRGMDLRAWEDVVRLREELRQAMQEYRGAERLAGSLPGAETEGKDTDRGLNSQR